MLAKRPCSATDLAFRGLGVHLQLISCPSPFLQHERFLSVLFAVPGVADVADVVFRVDVVRHCGGTGAVDPFDVAFVADAGVGVEDVGGRGGGE